MCASHRQMPPDVHQNGQHHSPHSHCTRPSSTTTTTTTTAQPTSLLHPSLRSSFAPQPQPRVPLELLAARLYGTAVMSNPWGQPPNQSSARRGLTLSTSSALNPSSNRHSGNPSSATFSPAPPSSASQQQQAPPPSSAAALLSSSRARALTPSAGTPLASTAAALPAAIGSQGGGGSSSSGSGGGGIAKLARGSPSLSQSSGVGSPVAAPGPPPSTTSSTQSLSKIVVAQIFLLLSGVKGDSERDRANLEQVKKVRFLFPPSCFLSSKLPSCACILR